MMKCIYMFEMQHKPLVLIADEVINVLQRGSRSKIESRYIDTVNNNCKEVIIDYFRTYGTELLNLDDDSCHVSNSEVIKCLQQKACRNLPMELANLLLSAIAEVFTNPEEDIVEAINNLIYTYMSAAILNLDPELKEMSAMKLQEKVFIIDTDVLVGCIVKEHPKFESYISVIRGLSESKCRIIVPMLCIQECVLHASYSKRTYNFFRDQLRSMPEEAIEDEVWNGFVQGYYYGINSGSISPKTTYDQYLRNYYDALDPNGYMISLVFDTLGNNIEVVPIDKLTEDITIPPEESERLTTEIFIRMKDRARKADYRTELQTKELSTNDAKLYLSTYYLNKRVQVVDGKFMSQKYYLITNSSRTGYCAYKAGFEGKIISKLPLIATLLRRICDNCISSKEFIGLLENPFIAMAMNLCRGEISDLIKTGVNLRGFSITRLRYDLDQVLHEKITVIEKCLETGDAKEAEILEDQVIDILDEINEMGYDLEPTIARLVKAYKRKIMNFESKDKSLDKYQATVQKFSARRQRYFERIRKGEFS